MKINVRLHAVLRDLLPGGRGEVDVPSGATVKDLLDQLEIDEELRELVTVNGEQVREFVTPLGDGDDVQVFPAVAGGAKRSPYLDEGIRLFNAGDYFMAHETLEEHWIDAEDSERDFYQALIHLAVGFHHYKRDNRNGARSQFFKAAKRLATYPDEFEGVDVQAVRRFLEEAQPKLEKEEPLEPPKLEVDLTDELPSE